MTDPRSTSRSWSKRFGDFVAVDTSRSTSRAARSSAFWGPTGRGSRPPSASCADCWRRLRAARRSAASMSRRSRKLMQAEHRLHVAEVLALRRPDGGREHRLLRRHLRRAAGEAAAAARLCAAHGGPGRQAQDHDAPAPRRLETAAGAGLRDPSRAADSVSGRAHQRRGPDRAAQFLGPDLPAFRGGPHHLRQHALHGRSRILPPPRADVSAAR